MINDISCVATLILFAIYFVGKIILIIQVRKIVYDKIETVDNTNLSLYRIVEDIGSDNLDFSIIITSVMGMHNLKIWKCELQGDTAKLKKTELVAEIPFINIGNSVKLNLNLIEGIPSHIIEFTTNDFMKVSFTNGDNLKSGVFSEFIHSKHTFQSIIYYLFK